MRRLTVFLVWSMLASALILPLAIALTSPFLAGRNLAYIIASIAGILCLGLFLAQPLLAAGYLPGVRPTRLRKIHRLAGIGISICVLLHIGGLYLTSPPDTLDALLLVSPTPFSVYGVIALWGVVLTVLLVVLRRRLNLSFATWRVLHNLLALGIVIATLVHALQIEGTMGAGSKWALSGAVLVATVVVVIDLRVVRPLLARRSSAARTSED